MTTLQKVDEILNKPDKVKKKYYLFRPERPVRECSFNKFEIPQSRQQNKTKETLSKILAFIDSQKSLRFSDGVTILPLSVTNKRLLSIFGSSMNISRAISFMKEIGLLSDYVTHYQYNQVIEKNNKCKLYAYSKEREEDIINYCKVNSINIYKKSKKHHYNVKNFPVSAVRFSSKLHLMKPANMSVAEFEEYLCQLLTVNYPALPYYQKLAEQINETYYKDFPDLQITFKPSFTWSKGNKAVRKIGIRATNRLVSVKNEREKDDDANIMYKDEVLTRYGLKYSYDVPSSVPRVTYLMNHGVWLGDNIDLYKNMYDLFITRCPSEALTWDKINRKIFKSFHMAAYFDKPTMLSGHIKRHIAQKTDYKAKDWISIDNVMFSYRTAVEKTLGKLYDSEIFYHESCIYMEVLKALLDKGYFVWQQYDCFYSDKPIDNIQKIIKQIAEHYITKQTNKPKYQRDNQVIRNTNKISLVNIFETQWLNL